MSEVYDTQEIAERATRQRAQKERQRARLDAILAERRSMAVKKETTATGPELDLFVRQIGGALPYRRKNEIEERVSGYVGDRSDDERRRMARRNAALKDFPVQPDWPREREAPGEEWEYLAQSEDGANIDVEVDEQGNIIKIHPPGSRIRYDYGVGGHHVHGFIVDDAVAREALRQQMEAEQAARDMRTGFQERTMELEMRANILRHAVADPASDTYIFPGVKKVTRVEWDRMGVRELKRLYGMIVRQTALRAAFSPSPTPAAYRHPSPY